MTKLNLHPINLLPAAMLLVLSSANCAYAQSYATSLRVPLIQGAQSTQAGQAPQQGAAPPIGSGSTPTPVTPGMSGDPTAPPSDVPVPPMSALQHFEVGALVAPYLTPPPSSPGADPGMLPPINGYQPDAAVVNINAQGGLPNSAPTKRRGGQTTADYGLVRTKGSQLTDFGQLLPNMPNLQAQPQYSQDGPRTTLNGGLTGVNRTPNLAGSQTTQDLYGFRQQFDGTTRPKFTIAPY